MKVDSVNLVGLTANLHNLIGDELFEVVYPNTSLITDSNFKLEVIGQNDIVKYCYYPVNNPFLVTNVIPGHWFESLSIGKTYKWYAVDSLGNQSEEYSFRYLPLAGTTDSVVFVNTFDGMYINENSFMAIAESMLDISLKYVFTAFA